MNTIVEVVIKSVVAFVSMCSAWFITCEPLRCWIDSIDQGAIRGLVAITVMAVIYELSKVLVTKAIHWSALKLSNCLADEKRARKLLNRTATICKIATLLIGIALGMYFTLPLAAMYEDTISVEDNKSLAGMIAWIATSGIAAYAFYLIVTRTFVWLVKKL